MANLRDRLLAATAASMPRQRVRVPELDEDGEPPAYVYVRGLSAAERDRILRETSVGKGRKARTDVARLRPLLVARTVINEDGTRVYADSEVGQLGEIRSDVFERIFSASAKISGLVDADDDVDDDEADAGKKSVPASGTVQSGSSTTD